MESGDERLAERSRSATPAAKPQTEARRSCGQSIAARDERAVCGVERATSRGGRDDGQPVERSERRVGHGESTGYVRYDETSVVGGRKGDVLAEIRWRWTQNDFNI